MENKRREDTYEDDYQEESFRSKPHTPAVPSKTIEPLRSSDNYDEDDPDFGDTDNLLDHTQKAPTALRNPQVLLSSGNSDQNAASDEYQEIGDNELDEEQDKQERRAKIEARRQEILKE